MDQRDPHIMDRNHRRWYRLRKCQFIFLYRDPNGHLHTIGSAN